MSDPFRAADRLGHEEVSLAPDELHVYAVSLAPPPETVAELETLLTPDEVERAYRFRFERHRRRFIVGRGVLRPLRRHGGPGSAIAS